MEEDHFIDAMTYAINMQTGERTEIGKGKPLILEIGSGGMEEFLKGFDGRISYGFDIKLKPIKKKRFIKLLMSLGYQRNDAIKIQKEYIKEYSSYTEVGMKLFLILYNL